MRGRFWKAVVSGILALIAFLLILAVGIPSCKMVCYEANTLMVLGRYEEALNCYDRAIEINPGNAEAWF